MGGSGSEGLKKCPSPSPAVLWLMNFYERKPRYKKQTKKEKIRIIIFGWLHLSSV